jgi:hypothetical protein
MIIESQPKNGLLFALEKDEFKLCDWKGFLAEIKNLDGWKYDAENKQWYIPESAVQAFSVLRAKYIDAVIQGEHNEI